MLYLSYFLCIAIQVFSATNVELVTKTRMEHLSEQDKERSKKNNNKSPIESFLGVAEEHSKTQGASNGVSLCMILYEVRYRGPAFVVITQ